MPLSVPSTAPHPLFLFFLVRALRHHLELHQGDEQDKTEQNIRERARHADITQIAESLFVDLIHERVRTVLRSSARQYFHLIESLERADQPRYQQEKRGRHDGRQSDSPEFFKSVRAVYFRGLVISRVDVLHCGQHDQHVIAKPAPYAHNGERQERGARFAQKIYVRAEQLIDHAVSRIEHIPPHGHDCYARRNGRYVERRFEKLDPAGNRVEHRADDERTEQTGGYGEENVFYRNPKRFPEIRINQPVSEKLDIVFQPDERGVAQHIPVGQRVYERHDHRREQEHGRIHDERRNEQISRQIFFKFFRLDALHILTE